MQSYLYMMPTQVGYIGAQDPGIKIGVSTNAPWDRLRTYNRSGTIYRFSGVWEGDANLIATMEKNLKWRWREQAMKRFYPGSSCDEIFIGDPDKFFKDAEACIEESGFALKLVHENYEACRASDHTEMENLKSYEPSGLFVFS